MQTATPNKTHAQDFARVQKEGPQVTSNKKQTDVVVVVAVAVAVAVAAVAVAVVAVVGTATAVPPYRIVHQDQFFQTDIHRQRSWKKKRWCIC